MNRSLLCLAFGTVPLLLPGVAPAQAPTYPMVPALNYFRNWGDLQPQRDWRLRHQMLQPLQQMQQQQLQMRLQQQRHAEAAQMQMQMQMQAQQRRMLGTQRGVIVSGTTRNLAPGQQVTILRADVVGSRKVTAGGPYAYASRPYAYGGRPYVYAKDPYFYNGGPYVYTFRHRRPKD